MKFEERVSEFMARHGYTPSQFGRAAMKDPNFVLRLRKGRQVTERIMDKVDAWMAQQQTDATIKRMRAQGAAWKVVADALGVSVSHVRARARELGVK